MSKPVLPVPILDIGIALTGEDEDVGQVGLRKGKLGMEDEETSGVVGERT